MRLKNRPRFPSHRRLRDREETNERRRRPQYSANSPDIGLCFSSVMSTPMVRGNGSTGSSSDISDFYQCDYLTSALTVFVVGASGDLAKKKTYPSLFSLFAAGYLPESVIVCGYARSKRTDEEFREGMRKQLKGEPDTVNRFLETCIYRSGQYDDAGRVGEVFDEISEWRPPWELHVRIACSTSPSRPTSSSQSAGR